MKNILSKTTILLFTLVFLSACGTQEPTLDPNAILTQVILSVEAGSSQTALAAPPTNTPTPPSPSPEPSQTSTVELSTATNTTDPNITPSETNDSTLQTATSTQSALATGTSPFSIPTATIASGNTNPGVCYKAAFIRELDPYDYQELPRNITKNKMWQIKNVGTCPWNGAFSLVLLASIKNGAYVGDTLGMDAVTVNPFLETSQDPTKTIARGENAWITIFFDTPSDPGVYELHFKLQAPDGSVFGIDGDGALWVIFTIK